MREADDRITGIDGWVMFRSPMVMTGTLLFVRAITD